MQLNASLELNSNLNVIWNHAAFEYARYFDQVKITEVEHAQVFCKSSSPVT